MVKRNRCACGNFASGNGLCYRCMMADETRGKLREALAKIEAKSVTKKFKIHIEEINWINVTSGQLKDFLEMVDPKGAWVKFQISKMEDEK